MQHILILGGYGFTGRLLARHLLEQTGVRIILAGRSLEKAAALARELNSAFSGQRVTARRVDAASVESMRSGLEGVDFLLVASNTAAHARTVIDAALAAGVDYLDVQLDRNKLKALQERSAEIAEAGRCYITEAGFHPGLPAALARFAAGCMESVYSIEIAGFLNMGSSLPYTEAVDELMQAFLDYQAQIFHNGQWTPPHRYTMRKINFGGSIGKRACTSMFFEELRDLPASMPTLRELGFYMAGTHWFTDWVLTLIVMAGLKIAPRRGIRPLGRLLWWGMQRFHHPPYTVAVLMDARGETDGRPVHIEGMVAHPDGYELTAIPVVACLQQILDGSARQPGLWMMGHIVDPARLLADMQHMGVKVTFSQPQPAV